MRDITLGDTIDVKFTTRQFSSGAPFTLAGTPAVSAYPSNSTTQITAGITLSVDFDSVTGLNNVRVVATSGNGYAADTEYALVITTGTVDSVSVVGEVVGEFRTNQASTASQIADQVWDEARSGHTGTTTFGYSLQNPTPTAVQNRQEMDSNSTQLAAIVADTNELQTDDIPGTLSTIASYIDTEVAAIKAKTDNLPASPAATSDIPTAAEVRAEIDSNSTQLAAIVADTDELQTNQGDWATAAGFSTHSAADAASAVLTTQMTESYAANGTAPTLAQAQFAIHQMLMQFGISGTSLTVKKLDNSTTAFIVTLDDDTSPTSAART